MFFQTLFSSGYWQAVRAGEASLSFLWSMFLQDYFGLISASAIGLSCLVIALLCGYVLPRSHLRWTHTLAVASVVALAVIISAVYVVESPSMYRQAGLGQPNPECPVLVRDKDGKLVFEQTMILHEGQPKQAMVAQKYSYLLESPPYVGTYKGEQTVGVLVRNDQVTGNFPLLCGVPLAKGGQKIIDRYKAYGTPINHELLQNIILGNWDEKFWQGLNEGKIKPSNIATLVALFMDNELLPANRQDLARAMAIAKRDVLGNVIELNDARLRAFMQLVGQYYLGDAYNDPEAAGYWYKLTETEVFHYRQFDSLSLFTKMTPTSWALTIYGDYDGQEPLDGERLIKAVTEAQPAFIASLGQNYVTRISEVLEASGVHNRQPSITLPGEAPFTILEQKKQQDGDEESDDQGQQGDPAQKQPNQGSAQEQKKQAQASQSKSEEKGEKSPPQLSEMEKRFLEVLKQHGLKDGNMQNMADFMANQPAMTEMDGTVAAVEGKFKSDTERF